MGVADLKLQLSTCEAWLWWVQRPSFPRQEEFSPGHGLHLRKTFQIGVVRRLLEIDPYGEQQASGLPVDAVFDLQGGLEVCFQGVEIDLVDLLSALSVRLFLGLLLLDHFFF